MHDGCSGQFENGLQVLQKIRMMGFNMQPMPVPAHFKCHECEEDIQMTTLEYRCPSCGLIYAVTPCHSFDIASIMPAGRDI